MVGFIHHPAGLAHPDLPPQSHSGGSGGAVAASNPHPDLAIREQSRPYGSASLPSPLSGATAGSVLWNPGLSGSVAPTPKPGCSQPFRPWSEPLPAPGNVDKEADLDPSSLPSLLQFLRNLDSSLVSGRPPQSDILSEPEALARQGKQVDETLLASQSPLLASILLKSAEEIKGKEAPEEGPDFRGPGPKPLRQGQFLPSGRRLRAFSKPNPPLAPGALPACSLKLTDSDRAILPSYEGKSNVALSASLSDKTLSDWEELLRLGLENASLAERLSTVLYTQSLSVQHREALLLALSTTLRASLNCQARSYLNVILARRDAVLAKAKARVSTKDREFLRVLPLDSSGASLFGKGLSEADFLQPLSESAQALRALAQAAQSKGKQGQSPQRGTKRNSSPSPNTGVARGQSPQKKRVPFRKRHPFPKGDNPKASSKPASKSGAHPQ